MEKKVWMMAGIAVILLVAGVGLFSVIDFKEGVKKNSFIREDNFKPGVRIDQSQIKVYRDQVYIGIKNAQWAQLADTNSMLPTFDKNHHLLHATVQTREDLQVGDIISFRVEGRENNVVHRIVKIDYDEIGWYAKTKGDNLKYEDPMKVRFSMIDRVVVGILY